MARAGKIDGFCAIHTTTFAMFSIQNRLLNPRPSRLTRLPTVGAEERRSVTLALDLDVEEIWVVGGVANESAKLIAKKMDRIFLKFAILILVLILCDINKMNKSCWPWMEIPDMIKVSRVMVGFWMWKDEQ